MNVKARLPTVPLDHVLLGLDPPLDLIQDLPGYLDKILQTVGEDLLFSWGGPDANEHCKSA
jgi:hypothetical protein